MSFMEVYYERYDMKRGRWEGKKYIPYCVLIHNKLHMDAFHDFLVSEGFKCVCWGSECKGIYVNFGLRRFAQIPKAVGSGCVNSRDYSIGEFFMEVYMNYIKNPDNILYMSSYSCDDIEEMTEEEARQRIEEDFARKDYWMEVRLKSIEENNWSYKLELKRLVSLV